MHLIIYRKNDKCCLNEQLLFNYVESDDFNWNWGAYYRIILIMSYK